MKQFNYKFEIVFICLMAAIMIVALVFCFIYAYLELNTCNYENYL